MAIINQTTNYHQALEIDEQEDWWDATADFGQYGITGAVTSGLVSILNTGKAFGNALGGEFEYTETDDVLSDFGWEDTAKYYRENKSTVDAVGFGMTALIPGMVGLKAAKLAQKGLATSNSTSRLVTGLRKGLVPADAKKSAYRHVANNANYYDNGYKIKLEAIKKGFHQQAVENAFAETAIMATMNQNPILTGKDLDYFGAIGENLDSAAFGFAFGTGIAGTIDSAVTYTTLKGLLKNDMKTVNEVIQTSTVDSAFARLEGIPTGDRISVQAAQEHQAREAVKKFSDAHEVSGSDQDSFIAKLAQGKLSQFERSRKKLFVDLTKSPKNPQFDLRTEELIPELERMYLEMSPEARSNTFSGMRKVTVYGDENTLLNPKAHKFDALDDDQIENWYRKGEGIPKGKKLSDEDAAIVEGLKYTRSGGSTRGAAMPGNSEVGAFVNNKVLNGKDRDLAIFVMRHEMGHMNTDKIARVFDTKYGGQVKDELVQLSKEARPQQWSQLTQYRNLLEKGKQQIDNLSDVEIRQLGDLEAKLNRQTRYLESPEELLADAGALFNNLDLTKDLARRFPMTFDILQDNLAMQKAVGPIEKLIDTRTKEMFDVTDRAPTARDYGFVKVAGSQVKTARGNFDVSKQFDPLADDITPLKASAHYYEAMERPITKGNVTINEGEINKFLKVLQGAKVAGETNSKFIPTVTVKSERLGDVTFDFKNITTGDEFANEISKLRKIMNEEKIGLMKELVDKDKYSEDDIARILDLDLNTVQTRGLDMRTMESWSEVYDPRRPSVMKVLYDNNDIKKSDMGEAGLKSYTGSLTRIEESLKLASQKVDEFLAGNFGESISLPDAVASMNTRTYGDITNIDQLNGFLVSFQADYDSLSHVKAVGAAHKKLDDEGLKRIDSLVASNAREVQRDQDALYELSAIDSKLRQDFYRELDFESTNPTDLMQRVSIELTGKELTDPKRAEALSTVFDILQGKKAESKAFLMSEELEKHLQSALSVKRITPAKIKRLEELAETESLQVMNQKTADFYKAYNRANGMIVDADEAVNLARGKNSALKRGVWYPGSLNRQRYKSIMYVKPRRNGVMGTNKPGIIGAPTDEGLQAKVQQVRDRFGEDVVLRTAKEMEEDFKAMGVYDVDLALDEFNVNSALKRKGVLWDIAADPTPQLVDDMLTSMKRQWLGKTKQLMRTKYSREFSELEALDAEQGRLLDAQQNVGKKDRGITKAEEIMNIMLNVTDSGKFAKWMQSQEELDKAISGGINGLASMFKSAKDPVDFKKLNEYRDRLGLPEVFDAGVVDYVMQTEKVNDRILSSTVPMLNAAAGTMMLRLDLIQPVINAMSLPILAAPEMKHLVESLPELQKKQARNLVEVVHPNTGKVELSNTRLMYGATKNWFDKDIRAEYDSMGLIDNIAKEFHDSLDGISVTAKELGDEATISNRVKKVADFLSKPADMTESFVRFVAANMSDQVLTRAGITDKSLRQQVMRTYVDRVIGNYTYAQRPKMFQGFVGQAVGLFQTYQFNLIQQMLRHMGTDPKRAASMMGIQAGIFGAQSVPGFELLNSHIADRSEGDYKDFYTTSDDMFGDTISQWIMYGAGSNFTRPVTGEGLALYTRGNLNPRTATIVPTSLDEIPAYSMTTRFIDTVGAAASNIANGAPVDQVFYQAMAHNSLNRPLAGLGQMLAGTRTTRQGSMLFALDDLDAWQIGARLMGTQPLNEAVAVESFYRTKKYSAARQDKLNSMGESAKEMMRGGGFDREAYYDMMQKYTKWGGNYEYFDRWVNNQAINATQSQIDQLYKSNNSDEGLYLQSILGADVREKFAPLYNQSRVGQQEEEQQEQQGQQGAVM